MVLHKQGGFHLHSTAQSYVVRYLQSFCRLFLMFILYHITPLVIIDLRGRHTHAHTPTLWTKVISRNQLHAWLKAVQTAVSSQPLGAPMSTFAQEHMLETSS